MRVFEWMNSIIRGTLKRDYTVREENEELSGAAGWMGLICWLICAKGIFLFCINLAEGSWEETPGVVEETANWSKGRGQWIYKCYNADSSRCAQHFVLFMRFLWKYRCE